MSDETPDPSLEEEIALVEVLHRVLDRGAVVAGEVTISVAGIDLVELGLHLYLASSLTAREAGVSVFPDRSRSRPLPPASDAGAEEASPPHPPDDGAPPAEG